MTLKKRERAKLYEIFDNIMNIYNRIPTIVFQLKDNVITYDKYSNMIAHVHGNLKMLNALGLISESTFEESMDYLVDIHDSASAGDYKEALGFAEEFYIVLESDLKRGFADIIRKGEYVEYPPTIPLMRVAEDGDLYVYTEGIGWKKPDTRTLKEEDVRQHVIDYYGEDFYHEQLEKSRRGD